jgi:hypothetical protein
MTTCLAVQSKATVTGGSRLQFYNNDVARHFLVEYDPASYLVTKSPDLFTKSADPPETYSGQSFDVEMLESHIP